RQLTDSAILEINSRTPYTDCTFVLAMSKNSPNPLPEFISQGTLRIVDAKGRSVKGLPKVILLDNKNLKQKFTLPKMKGVDKLYGYFSYKCAGVIIRYKKELLVNRENDYFKHLQNTRKLWISGTLEKNFLGWSLDLLLANKITYNGTFHGQSPVIGDVKGKPYKPYIMRWGKSSAAFPLILPLAKGNRVKFLVDSKAGPEGLVHEIRVQDPLQTALKKVPFSLQKGSLVSGRGDKKTPNLKYMSDLDPDTETIIESDSQHKVELTFKSLKTSISNMYAQIGTTYSYKKSPAEMMFKIEYFAKGKWHKFSWGRFMGVQAFYPSASTPKANKFKLTFYSSEEFKVHIRELHFMK
ncbi:MAG: hypothetical protein HRT88_13780, partial [Lentisphaeraceae bacterium]|nr:hypothetical protein [Lentisphaeraceae bacterium]